MRGLLLPRAGPGSRVARRPALRALAAPLAALALLGCQTTRSWNQGCPGPYSGVRYFGDQWDAIPIDGKIFFVVDLPLSAVADTLLLPFALWVEPERPPGGFPAGCRWVERRRR